MSVRAAWAVAIAAASMFAAGCSGGTTPDAAAKSCPTVQANGHAATLAGHAPSATATVALHLYLEVNRAAVVRAGGATPNGDLSNLVGEFDLPTDHWVLVKSPTGTAVYEHKANGGRRDFQIGVVHTSDGRGWAVDDVGRCS